MSDVDPLSDLAIRRRQLETHLLQSHDYREKVARHLKVMAFVKLTALILVLGETVMYVRKAQPASPVFLGLIALTLVVLIVSTFLIVHAWRCLSRLNESWLTPEARNAWESLRLEQARAQSSAL